ncbi:hypothetical protein FIBSPDRAFT_402912 [Athelia psychrophila]|uniref:Condensation domain-containing protein n=1 Tax=Athelia psychrophila TaxID=1759441 RepID=A0A166NIK7_9AGAM|nr:hypothetical protein FIBSPDRAFT_402912 [Fibularhizoctonia sp. CBS 109695]
MENSLSPWSWSPGPPFPSTRVVDPARTWNRRLWGGEIIFAQGTRQQPGRGDGMVSCSIEPPSSLSHAHVRAAFRHLRFKHPSIASQVAWSEGDKEARFMYEAPRDEFHVEAWLDATTFERTYTPGLGLDVEASLEHWRSELAHAHCPRTNHLLTLYHISPSGSNSGAAHGLLLYAHHSLFDGIAAWQVLGCVLSEIACVIGGGDERAWAPLAWGEEYARLARAVPDRTETKWEMEDMNQEWPAVKHMQAVLQRPSVNILRLANPAPARAPWRHSLDRTHLPVHSRARARTRR